MNSQLHSGVRSYTYGRNHISSLNAYLIPEQGKIQGWSTPEMQGSSSEPQGPASCILGTVQGPLAKPQCVVGSIHLHLTMDLLKRGHSVKQEAPVLGKWLFFFFWPEHMFC